MTIEQKTEKNLERAIDSITLNWKEYVFDPNRDFTRNRKLSLKDTIRIVLAMKGGCLNKEIYEYNCTSENPITTSGFIQSKKKIKPVAFRDLFCKFNAYCADPITFHGYHLYAVDGTDLNIYRNPDNTYSFVRNASCPEGYNQLHLNALYDLCNKTYKDCVIQPKRIIHEQAALWKMLESNSFEEKSIIIADRGYEGYNTIAHLLNTPNIDFLIRIKNEHSFRDIRKLPMEELDVDMTIEVTTSQTNDDKRHNRVLIQRRRSGKHYSDASPNPSWDFPSPYQLRFRIVRVQLESGKYETLCTSLPRSKFPPALIKELYHLRWGIETSFRELKYTIGLAHLHTKNEEWVAAEIYAALIMYNFCERIAVSVIVKQKAEIVHVYQINFSMAVTICRNAFKAKVPLSSVVDNISRYVSPVRRSRTNMRKIRPKSFVAFNYRISA